MAAHLGHQAEVAGDHALAGQQRGAGERAGAGQAARVAGGRQHQPDLVGVQLGQRRQRLAQRHVGPRAGGVGDEVLLVAGDLVGQLVERHQAGAPGAHPGHEPGATGASARVAALAAGDMQARVRAARAPVSSRRVGRRGVAARPTGRLASGACMGRTCSPATGAGARWCPRSTPSRTWWSRTPTPASAARWSASSRARWCWRTGTAGAATSRWSRPRSCSTAQVGHPAPAGRRGRRAGRAAAHRLGIGRGRRAYARRSPGPAGSGSRASTTPRWSSGSGATTCAIEGVVVEPLDGIDDLADGGARRSGPGPARRLGVLVDHLVPGLQGEPDRRRR